MALIKEILLLALFVYNASTTPSLSTTGPTTPPSTRKVAKKFTRLNVEEESWDTMEISSKMSRAASHEIGRMHCAMKCSGWQFNRKTFGLSLGLEKWLEILF